MPDFKAIEVLTQAKERLFDKGWCNGPGAGFEGREELCLGQAMSGTRSGWGDESARNRGGASARAHQYLRDSIGLPDNQFVWVWNDEQDSASGVFDAIDRAIEIAKEAPTPC